MKRSCLTAVFGLASMLVLSNSVAAQTQTQTKNGVYLGVIGSLVDGSMRSGDGAIDLKPSGALFGARLGYNKTVQSWVLGAEIDAAHSRVEGTERFTANGYETAFDSDHDYVATARLRAGRHVGRALLYGTGGLARAHSDASVTVRGPDNRQIGRTANDVSAHTGWALGIGMEVPINDRLSFTGEWTRIDFPGEELVLDIGAFPQPMRETAHFDMHALRVGMNLRLRR